MTYRRHNETLAELRARRRNEERRTWKLTWALFAFGFLVNLALWAGFIYVVYKTLTHFGILGG